jgi:putative ABC transport system permease protein
MTLLRDLRYALRGLARQPGFTAVAVLTLGLAIGANTAIFSVASGLLLRPLPLPDSARLVLLMRQFAAGQTDSMSVPKFFFMRDHLQSELSHVSAYQNLSSGFNLLGDGPPERILGTHVTSDFLATVGVSPILGRDFLPEEDAPGARHTVILSHRLWVRRFGADAHILGRQLVLNGEGYTVVGVMPASFRFPATAELWTPFGLNIANTDDANYFQFLGRLRPGVSLTAAATKAKALTPGFIAAYPGSVTPGQEAFSMEGLQERLYGRTRPALLVLMAAVGAVLLIACVNLANLQLARAAARQREIALRTVLGAGAGRIVRQLLTENLLLGLLGGAAGLLLGAIAVGPLMRLSPVGLDPLAAVGIDGRVLGFTLLLSLASGLLFGLAPALQALRSNLADPLKEGSNRTAGSLAAQWVRRALVISEVALALVLITSATLLVRSFLGLLDKAPGFEVDHVLTMKLSLPTSRYATGAAIDRFATEVTGRLESLPGVTSAAVAMTMPLEGGPDMTMRPIGRATGGFDGKGNFDVQYRPLTPDLFKVLHMTVRRGRSFAAADRVGASAVVLVNETAARQIWPAEDPLGRQVVVGEGAKDVASTPRTVVGIVGDTRERGLDRPLASVLYVPMGQVPDSFLALLFKLLPVTVAVHTTADSPGLTRAVQKEIWAVDPGQPIDDVKTMREIRDQSLSARRFTTLLLGLLALLALALASVGIYGVLSYLVQQRTREIGVRMALGASTNKVLRLVLRQGMGSVLIGIALGLAGSLALTRLLTSQLYDVTAHDPLTFTLTPVLLAAVAVLASSIPAYRASHLDPLIALRQE